MLPRDAGGVVDTNLLVYGTKNVRIVDGSIFPYQPSAHPMGLTYALAVMAARILEESRGAGGLTITEQIPPSNASANATAVFPTGTGSVMSPIASAPSASPYTGTGTTYGAFNGAMGVFIAIVALMASM